MTDKATPTPAQLIHRIRLDTWRLTTHTYTPTDALAIAKGARRSPVTRPPLIAEIRDAIRPDQGGTRRGSSTGPKLPFDETALEHYDHTVELIATMYESALERRPVGTPEQLLLAWLHDFESAYDRGDLLRAQLETNLQRLSRLRRRLEEHFDPPETREYPICPRCGYTHHLVPVDGHLVQTRCLVVRLWPNDPRRDPIAGCGNCGSAWVGRLGRYLTDGAYQPGLDDLDSELKANVDDYGDLDNEIILAPPTDHADRSQG